MHIAIKAYPLVECNNPAIKELISHTGRYINKEWLKPLMRGNKRFCAWCFTAELKPAQKKYCGYPCLHSSTVFSNPTHSGIAHILERQDWKCNRCSHSWLDGIIKLYNRRLKSFRECVVKYPEDKSWKGYLDRLEQGYLDGWMIAKQRGAMSSGDNYLEIDHIIPVSHGGTTLGLENLQALCSKCHKEKTNEDYWRKREGRIGKCVP